MTRYEYDEAASELWHMDIVHEVDESHVVEIVQRDRRTRGDDAAYWRCSCGASAGGRWYRSTAEAGKAADRHVERAVGAR